MIPKVQPTSIEVILQKTYKRYLQHKKCIDELHQFEHPEIIEPYQYLLNKGGKKIRVLMAILLSDMFDNQLKIEVMKVGGLIECLHSASLIVDDIEDNSIERRGEKCAHLIYGLDNSINAANLMYFLPFKNFLSCISDMEKKCKIMEVYMNEMINCHIGQGKDIQVHKITKPQQLPCEKQYEKITSAKTGSLLRMMIGIIGVLLDIPEDTIKELSNCMTYMGITFQITDDILNLMNRVDKMGKGVIAEDLHQKKFTLIINQLRDNQQFMTLFLLDQKDSGVVQKMLQIIDSSNAIQKCKIVAAGYAKKAIDCLQKIICPYSKVQFKLLVQFMIERKN